MGKPFCAHQLGRRARGGAFGGGCARVPASHKNSIEQHQTFKFIQSHCRLRSWSIVRLRQRLESLRPRVTHRNERETATHRAGNARRPWSTTVRSPRPDLSSWYASARVRELQLRVDEAKSSMLRVAALSSAFALGAAQSGVSTPFNDLIPSGGVPQALSPLSTAAAAAAASVNNRAMVTPCDVLSPPRRHLCAVRVLQPARHGRLQAQPGRCVM